MFSENADLIGSISFTLQGKQQRRLAHAAATNKVNALNTLIREANESELSRP